jgi:hypothetical protein
MPDANAPIDVPGDWQQALAALPLESPPPGGWDRIAGRLPPVRRRHRRWPVAMAAAATLATLAVVPLLWWRASPPAPTAPVATNPAGPRPATETAAVAAMPEPAAEPASALSPATATERLADSRGNPPAAGATATPAPQRTTDRPARAAAAADAPALEALYLESAHLESLLAQMQDERVASGPAMAMTVALQDRIAVIDHALSQPGSDVPQRELWQQRVDALRQLAGLEGTQRWLAASGNAGSDNLHIY